MKLLRGITQCKNALPQGLAATIGNFDGVHRGHQALLAACRSRATALGVPLLVILFEPQPSEYFLGSQAPSRLMGLREKCQALAAAGVDYVYCLSFNDTLAQMDAKTFAQHVIFNTLCVKYLLVGEDFRFGSQRRGDVTLLQALGHDHGCTVETFADYQIDGARISSTVIRQLFYDGQLAAAAAYLGRPYSLCGRVVKGDGRGRQWGFPTANVGLKRDKLPLAGVFVVEVHSRGHSSLLGVANIGRRPTVEGSSRLTLEVHLLDFNQSLYGELLEVVFIHKLRDEVKFASIEALLEQISKDITMARGLMLSSSTATL